MPAPEHRYIWLSQQKYIVRRFQMEGCNPVATPVDPNVRLQSDGPPCGFNTLPTTDT